MNDRHPAEMLDNCKRKSYNRNRFHGVNGCIFENGLYQRTLHYHLDLTNKCSLLDGSKSSN
jgi:hypothetical protein